MSGKTISTSETRIEALQLQSSAFGVVIPMVFGVTSVAGNLVDYNNFRSIPHTSTQGGKGGAGVRQQSTSYTYQASIVLGLCLGTISTILRVWRGKKIYTTPTDPELGFTVKTGALGQSPWSALAAYSGKSLGYSGLALVAADAYDLGSTAQVENHRFEVVGPLAYHLGSTVPDVDPALVMVQVLTQVPGGAGLPSDLLASWGAWSDYCVAAGLLVSPCLDTQQSAAAVLRQAAELTNTAPVWSGGQLKMVPYADVAESGNGRTYTPNTTPVYDLTDESYTPATEGDAPITVKLKSPSDRYNHWRVEFRNRANAYAVEIAEAKDLADIDANGLRTAPTLQAHWICLPEVARKVAQVRLQRSLYVCAEYTVPLPEHYAFVEPADLLTLTDAPLGMAQLPVRVTMVEEGDDDALTITAEDYPAGTSSAARYPSQAGTGYQADYNAAPGNVDAPLIFEAPADLTTTGLEVYAAVRGSGANWGGCQVWVSLDGDQYKQVGTVYGGARYGALSAPIAGSASVTGLGAQQLLSGTSADAATLQTLCFVGGTAPEFLAYQTASLTGAGSYTLGNLARGAYGTTANSHAAGDAFARVDDRIAKSGPLDVNLIGRTLHFKFCSFNPVGGGLQGLADVSAYTYTVTGAAARLRPGINGKGLALASSALALQISKAGSLSPSSISLAATRLGTLAGTVSWQVVAGTVTLSGSGDTRTIDPATLTTDGATIRASITDPVATYTADITIVKVREGADGGQGPQGPQGSQGTQGPRGGEGATTYFHVAYATVADGSAGFNQSSGPYIGTYVDTTATDSTDYTRYTWRLFQGAQGPKGDQGIQGTTGPDGQTSYLHIKYSNDGGSSFTPNNGEDAGTWLGTVVDFSAGDPGSPSAYSWVRIQGTQGPQGDQGQQGPRGSDGATTYFHVAYATVADGSVGFNQSSGPYIGTYVDTSATDSSDYTRYTWRLFQGAQGPKGDQGIQGSTGPNGQSSYLHIKYSNDGGATFTTNNGEDVGTWIGTYVDTTPTDSSSPGAYTWAKVQGPPGGGASNLLFNSDFTADLSGWAVATNSGITASPGNYGVNLSGTAWSISPFSGPGTGVLWAVQNGGSNSQSDYFEFAPTAGTPVQPGVRYVASAYTGAHRCEVDVFMYVYNSSGSVIANSALDSNAAEASGGQQLSGYKRLASALTMPAGAAYVRFMARKRATYAGETSSYMFVAQCQLEAVDASTSTPSAWSPGASAYLGNGTVRTVNIYDSAITKYWSQSSAVGGYHGYNPAA